MANRILDLVQNRVLWVPVTIAPVDQLREHGIQVTAQRLAVLRAVSSRPHVTADEIADIAQADIGGISRQAVYDALAVLVENDLLRRIQPVGSAARYEDRVNDNHHHLICRQCARVVDVDCAVGSAPCLTASDDHGYDIDEADVAYWGLCPECQKSNSTSNSLESRAAGTTNALPLTQSQSIKNIESDGSP
jgi:Fur family transcriptional regulator, stress-responsive regulator